MVLDTLEALDLVLNLEEILNQLDGTLGLLLLLFFRVSFFSRSLTHSLDDMFQEHPVENSQADNANSLAVESYQSSDLS